MYQFTKPESYFPEFSFLYGWTLVWATGQFPQDLKAGGEAVFITF